MKQKMKLIQYDDETLNHIHEIELMILKDFIKFCEDNNITYFMYAGSLLGAIRHNGFIPWDDDLDVVMLREEFEKFKKLFSHNDKYDILSIESQENYPWLFLKLNLKNTRFEDKMPSLLGFQHGFNIDIFVLDDLSNNKYTRYYQILKTFFYNRLILTSRIRLDDLPFFPKIISHSLYYILNFLKLSPKKINKKYLNFLKKYSHANAKFVIDISARVDEYPLIYEKDWFNDVEKAKFEDIYVNVPKNYDEILTELYGDYNLLPPEDERYNHQTVIIDFGEY